MWELRRDCSISHSLLSSMPNTVRVYLTKEASDNPHKSKTIYSSDLVSILSNLLQNCKNLCCGFIQQPHRGSLPFAILDISLFNLTTQHF